MSRSVTPIPAPIPAPVAAYLSAQEAARVLGVGKDALARLVTSGQLPFVPAGQRRRRYRREDVEHLAQGQRVGSPREAGETADLAALAARVDRLERALRALAAVAVQLEAGEPAAEVHQ
jgi:excisionase family DNA binding protein